MSEIGSRLGAGRAKGHLRQLSRGSWCEGTSHGVSWMGQELGSGIWFPQPVRTVLASPVSRRGVAEGLTEDRSPTHAGKTLLFSNRCGFLGRAWWPRAHVAPLPSLLPTVYKVPTVYRCQGPCDMQKVKCVHSTLPAGAVAPTLCRLGCLAVIGCRVSTTAWRYGVGCGRKNPSF